uniref:Uncharacterized protein n=1 Tax=Cacopsylla melanoneura TaxID=428564 RepID=A0A8D8Z901_9HEMI
MNLHRQCFCMCVIEIHTYYIVVTHAQCTLYISPYKDKPKSISRQENQKETLQVKFNQHTGDFMKKWTVEFMEFQSFLTHSSTLVLNFHRNKTAAPYRNKSGVWNVFHIIFPSTGWSVVTHL